METRGQPLSVVEAEGGNLAGRAASGAIVTIASQIGRIGLQMASVVVLARLLSPDDFGLLAIVLAIIGFGEIFRDFGLSQAAIQAATLSKSQSSNIFWINTGIGAILTALLAALAQPLSLAIGDDRLFGVALVLSPVFLLNGLAAQYRADLNRNLRFKELAFSDLAPAALALGLSVSAALAGWGYWSLVVNQLTVGLLTLCLLLAICRWLPKRYDKYASVRSLVNFGGNLLGVQTLVYISRNVDKAIIAGSLGVTHLGIYDRAYQLIMMPLNQINAPANRVALPVLSKIASDTKRYNLYLVRGQTAMLHTLTALFGLTTALAPVLIPFVLGAQWQQAVPIYQALALAGFSQGAGYVTYWVFLSKALTRSNLWYTLHTRPIIIMAIFLGSLWGVNGIAWGYSIALFVLWPWGIYWVNRLTPIPAWRLIAIGLRCILVYGLAGLVAYLSTNAIPTSSPLLCLLVGAFTFILCLVILFFLIPAYRRELSELVKMRSLLKKKR